MNNLRKEKEVKMSEQNYIEFEKWVAELFLKAEYSVEQNVRLEALRKDVDIIAEKEGIKYCVEIKFSYVTERAVSQICSIAEEINMIPILVTAHRVDEEKLNKYKPAHSSLIVIDIQNLLYAVKDFPKMRNELVSILSYSVENIEPKRGFISIDALQHDSHTESLIKEMEACIAGNSYFRKYEELCTELLRNIFSDDLALWRAQEKSNNDLYRFDLLCRIKDGNQKSFWAILERYFNSKYIIFEFKNYSAEITQKEIYTTERYLYAKALRSVAIIISANGYNLNAYWASKGCLRENGKLILLLNSDDLIEMNRLKLDNEDPSEYLLNKLDEILLELEK